MFYLLTLRILMLMFFMYIEEPIAYCQPPEGSDRSFYDQPPYVDNGTKPVYIDYNSQIYRDLNGQVGRMAHYHTKTPSSSLDVINPSVNSNIHELPGSVIPNQGNANSSESMSSSMVANVGVDSSMEGSSGINTPSNGIPENIHELDANFSPRSSLATERDISSPPSDVHELDTGQSCYPNGGNYDYYGYVAPDRTLATTPIDPTENIHRAPLAYRIKNSIKNSSIKFYGSGKTKLYWEIWEKDTGRYGSYRDFKETWDPKTNFFKSIWTDIKGTPKSRSRSGYDVLDVRSRGLDSTSSQVRDLLRKKRPFKK